MDNVITKDFAIRHSSSDGELQSTANKSTFGAALKSRLRKFHPSEWSFVNSLRRGRANYHLAQVEYPETEALPSGIAHILEPEQVAERIWHLKSASVSSRKSHPALLKRVSRDQPPSVVSLEGASSQPVQHHPSQQLQKTSHEPIPSTTAPWLAFSQPGLFPKAQVEN
jgi:hypothetical protein